MRPFNVGDLQALLSHHEPPCVSVYQHTHRSHPEMAQDPIRYRNLLKDVERMLKQKHAGRQADRLLAQLSSLDCRPFWQHQRDGLAVFVCPDYFACHRLSMPMPDLAVVTSDFHTKPLIRLLQSSRHYYVLALSQNRVTLFDASRDHFDEVDLRRVPKSLREALGIKVRQGQVDFRGSFSVDGAAPVFHGHGLEQNDRANDLRRFFRAVDRALWDYLKDGSAPLVLATQPHYHALFREVSHNPRLLEKGVVCDAENVSAEQLQARASQLVEPQLDAQLAQAVEAFQLAHSHRRGSTDLTEVAQAAAQGRIKQLLVEEGRQVWGQLNREDGTITPGASHKNPDDADLLDQIAELLLAKGGEVFVVSRDSMPAPTGLAAVYRY